MPPSRKPRLLTMALILVAAIGGAFFWRWNELRPEHCYQRGIAALESGNSQTVLRESRRLLATPGYEPFGRLLAGRLLMQSGRYAEALQELQHASWKKETDREALVAAAECFYALGQFNETIRVALVALERDPEQLVARRWLAAAYYDLGLTGNAVGQLSLISQADPRDARSERLLGLIEKDSENYTEAVKHYRESLNRDPQQPDDGTIRMELLESLVKLGSFDEALQFLPECKPGPQRETLAAEALSNTGETAQAHERLSSALHEDPDYLPALLLQGSLLMTEGRLPEATRSLERAVEQHPESGTAHFQLAQLYQRLGREDDASQETRQFERARAIEREFSDLHSTAAEQPQDADVRYRLGVLARQLRKPELATMWFRSALSIQANHPLARAALAEDSSTEKGAHHGDPESTESTESTEK